MRDALLCGFGDELMKLAIADVTPDPQDPNLPWRADSEARGIKNTAGLPSKVQTGHLGATGGLGKSDGTVEGYRKGEEQTGQY